MERSKFVVVQFSYQGKVFLETVPKIWVCKNDSGHIYLKYPKKNQSALRKLPDHNLESDYVLYDCKVKRLVETFNDGENMIATMQDQSDTDEKDAIVSSPHSKTILKRISEKKFDMPNLAKKMCQVMNTTINRINKILVLKY